MNKFSIVIPTLNEENYIGLLLNSLVHQTYQDFEVIIVDAKSKDKTKEKVMEYSGKLNLRFVESPKKGVSFQRNYGAVELSKYDNVIFFDADVRPDPAFLKKVNDYITKNPVDILTSWNIPMSDKLIDDVLYWAFNQLYMESVKNSAPVAVGTFIYVRKQAFIKAGCFDEEITLAEDFELAKRMYEKGFKYALLKEPGIKFSVRRLDEEGRGKFILKNIRAGIHYLKHGTIKAPGKFKHDFGTHK